MKKINLLLIAFAFVLAACNNETDNNTNTPAPKTTLAVSNLSDCNILNVDYLSVDFGDINSGKVSVKEISSGTQQIFFTLNTINGNVRCRTDAAIACDKNMKTEFTITNNTVIATTIDGKKDSLKNLFYTLNKPTTLKITNVSFTEITDVTWQNVSFANSQYENSVKSDTSVTKTVPVGAGYIFFKRKSDPITARTSGMVIVEQDEDIEFVFTDDTLIVETGNTSNTGKLGTLQSTVVWWDDAEGEMQPYFLKQSFVDYYSGSSLSTSIITDSAGTGYYYFYPPKNGYNAIRIGSTNTALLHLKINLAKNAKLSFWYANYFNGTAGTIFSVNGKEKAKWITNIDWSHFTIDLEPGENDLIWAKKDGVIAVNDAAYPYTSRYHYRYLSLDDILIYYTE